MPIVIKLNDGFLYSQTIKNLIDFKPANDDNYLVGKELLNYLSSRDKYPKRAVC